MRALSFSQPWLWSILHAGKRVENRPWNAPLSAIGQRFALHAAKSWDPDAIGFMRKLGLEPPGMYDLKKSTCRKRYPTSCLVGVATLDRTVTSDKNLPDDQKRWFFGEYGWILTDVIPFFEPIPATGKLGLWRVSEADEQKILKARVA
jgi:ASCH domain